MMLSLHPDYMLTHTLVADRAGPHDQRLRVALPAVGAGASRLRSRRLRGVLGHDEQAGLVRLRALAGRHRVAGVRARARTRTARICSTRSIGSSCDFHSGAEFQRRSRRRLRRTRDKPHRGGTEARRRTEAAPLAAKVPEGTERVGRVRRGRPPAGRRRVRRYGDASHARSDVVRIPVPAYPSAARSAARRTRPDTLRSSPCPPRLRGKACPVNSVLVNSPFLTRHGRSDTADHTSTAAHGRDTAHGIHGGIVVPPGSVARARAR